MPPAGTYVEPCLGGGSVLLNRAAGAREFAGDVDPKLMAFWAVMASRRDFPRLLAALRATAYDEPTFLAARDAVDALSPHPDDPWVVAPSLPPHEFARLYLVRARMSRVGLGRDFAWSERTRGKRHPDGPCPGDLNAWRTLMDELPRVHARVAGVGFEPGDVFAALDRHDGPDTLFYLDLPYLIETRATPDTYAHEVTPRRGGGAARVEADRAWHARLLRRLLDCRGKVMISGYPSATYADLLGGWRRETFPIVNHASQAHVKETKLECVWLNFPAGGE